MSNVVPIDFPEDDLNINQETKQESQFENQAIADYEHRQKIKSAVESEADRHQKNEANEMDMFYEMNEQMAPPVLDPEDLPQAVHEAV